MVVDGRIGFVGGINVTDEENETVFTGAYRDLHLRVEGAVVRSLQLVFVEDWVYAAGCDPGAFGEAAYWPPSHEGPVAAQVLVSGPDSSQEAIHRLQVAAIHEARRRVWLVTPYFIPGEAARMALTSAALGGLDTRLLVPRWSDSRLATLAGRSYFDELLKAGVQVYEYGPRMLHTKALLTDDLCIIGSANFDHRSFRLNFEVAMLLRESARCQSLARHIEGRSRRPGGCRWTGRWGCGGTGCRRRSRACSRRSCRGRPAGQRGGCTGGRRLSGRGIMARPATYQRPVGQSGRYAMHWLYLLLAVGALLLAISTVHGWLLLLSLVAALVLFLPGCVAGIWSASATRRAGK